MKLDRGIRNLLPPVMVFFSFMWALATDETHLEIGPLILAKSQEASKVITVAALSGVTLCAIGYLVTCFSLLLLSGIFWLYDGWFKIRPRSFSLGIRIAKESREAIFERVTFSLDEGTPDFSLFYPVTFFHHGGESIGKMRDWMVRRWNFFLISFNCLVALVSPLLLFPLVRVLLPKLKATSLGSKLVDVSVWTNLRWWGLILPCVIVLAFHTIQSYCEMRKMTEFLVSCEPKSADLPFKEVLDEECGDATTEKDK